MGPELVAQHQATASIAKELLDTGEKIHFCLDFIFNPCPTELFVSVFRSFEAGIAFFLNRHLLNSIILLTEHLPQTTLPISVGLFGLKSA